MFLTGPEIYRRWKREEIVIDPFNVTKLNPNSYDVTLADTIGWYEPKIRRNGILIDTNELNNPNLKFEQIKIPKYGTVLKPGALYLASTVERIGAHKLVPILNGKSSLGRLGISVHVTAGFCDVGFFGTVTLEITVVHPVVVYAGMRIGQISFQEVVVEIKPYEGRYQGQQGPTESRYKLENRP